MDIDESDCCGNGCANCILDVQLPKQTETLLRTGKKNIILIYSKFKLLSKKPHTAKLVDILELHFSSERETETADYILDIPAGHHVMMRATIPDVTGNGAVNLLRPYSPYWVDVTKLEFKILVNLTPNGQMSQYINNLQAGAEVDFRGPIGTYVHEAALEKHIYIISQGVAIAPTLPIVEQVLRNKDDMSRIVHLACFTDLSHFYFRESLNEFNAYWNYKSRVYLSRAKCGICSCLQADGCAYECDQLQSSLHYKELVFARRLTAAEIIQICAGIDGDGVHGGQKKAVIICGTREFQNFVADAFRKADTTFNEQNIYLL